MENDYRIYATRKKAYWGPIFWNFLYLTVMGFPVTLTDEQSREFANLIQKFHVFLPCADCRENYRREMKNVQLLVRDKNSAMEVVLHLHNQVRRRQNKKPLSVDQIISYHSNQSKNQINPFWIFVLLGLLVLFFRFFKLK